MRSTKVEERTCRRLLTRFRGDRAFTGDPFRGCEHDCVYCEARGTHEYLGCSPRNDFGTRIFAKRGAPEVLARELSRKVRPGDRIRLGVVSDPYLPAERDEGLTRECLAVLSRGPGVRLHLSTKSDLVLRDRDLLLEIGRRGHVSVSLSVSTLDAGLARRLEPGAPSPARRVRAVKRLSRDGIPAGVDVAPILPGLTDSLADLTALADAAAAAGAAWFRGRVLRLPPGTRGSFFAFLRRERPDLARRYRKRYAGGARAPRDYAERIGSMLAALRVERGLPSGISGFDDAEAGAAQLVLPFDRSRIT